MTRFNAILVKYKHLLIISAAAIAIASYMLPIDQALAFLNVSGGNGGISGAGGAGGTAIGGTSFGGSGNDNSASANGGSSGDANGGSAVFQGKYGGHFP